MGYTIGTYPGEMKKSLPRSSSPVLTAHQGASSRVLKGHPGIGFSIYFYFYLNLHIKLQRIVSFPNSFLQIFLFIENLPTLPDIPAVQAKLAKTSSVQQMKASKEDSGILNIENDAPKSMTTKVKVLFKFL